MADCRRRGPAGDPRAAAGRQTASTYDYYLTEYPHDYSVTWGFHHGLVEAIAFGYPLIDQYDTVWVGDANQTYIFLLFAGRIDPTIAQREFADGNPSVTEYDISEWRNVRFAGNYQSPPDSVPIDQLTVLYTSPHRDVRCSTRSAAGSSAGRAFSSSTVPTGSA